jgi:hypothetical protein
MRYASLCAIAKNEETAVEEWVLWHLALGFEHIHIYDNGGAVPLRHVLRRYTRAGLVTVIDFPLEVEQQITAYADCLERFGGRTRWLAFFDIDEFCLPSRHDDIKDVLDGYEDFGGLAIHWRMFGSCGHQVRPQGGVVANYTKVVACDNHIKSVVRPDRVLGVANPHRFIYRDGFFCVNEDRVPVATHHSYHTSKSIRLNHYYYKSREEFIAKIARGRPTNNKLGKRLRGAESLEDFERQEASEGLWTEDDAIVFREEKLAGRAASLASLAAFHRDSRATLEAFLKDANGLLEDGMSQEAAARLKTAMRYHDAPAFWIVAAKLCLRLGDAPRCLHFLSKLLTDEGLPWRGEAYACLAEYYRLQGDAQTAATLDACLAS